MNGSPARLLVIAGSDSGGGAGIQADIKTACAFGVYAMTAVTAVTAQDTQGIRAVHLVSTDIVREQIVCCLSDIGADAIKIGMLGSAEIVCAVADVLAEHAREIPVVLDPVLSSSSGTSLLGPEAVAALKQRLLSLATLLTPNIPEAEALAALPVRDSGEMARAGEKLRASGAKAVLVKGGHGDGEQIVDVFVEDKETRMFVGPRIISRNTHGTGCTLATAIACGLAQGRDLADSIERARAFVEHAIRTAPALGRGTGPLNFLSSLSWPANAGHPGDT